MKYMRINRALPNISHLYSTALVDFWCIADSVAPSSAQVCLIILIVPPSKGRTPPVRKGGIPRI